MVPGCFSIVWITGLRSDYAKINIFLILENPRNKFSRKIYENKEDIISFKGKCLSSSSHSQSVPCLVDTNNRLTKVINQWKEISKIQTTFLDNMAFLGGSIYFRFCLPENVFYKSWSIYNKA